MTDRIDHAAEARKHIDWAHEEQSVEGSWEYSVRDYALIAQAEATLALVLHALDPVVASTVREVAAQSGASAPTVRRYLDHLARTGRVSVSHRFGGRGRPEVLYRRAL